MTRLTVPLAMAARERAKEHGRFVKAMLNAGIVGADPEDARDALSVSQLDSLALADLVEELASALAEARDVIDQANGNIQGQTNAEIRDPMAYAALVGAVDSIDALLTKIGAST